MTDELFPVAYSTLTGEALIAKVLSRYKIEPVTHCQFWNRGLSDVYLVETQASRYVLRVSHAHWRSKSDIDFELELLDFLRQHCAPIAYPLRTQDEQLAIEIKAPEGKRYASLFIYAPGKVALGDLNPTQSQTLGETVAKLHLIGTNFCSHADRSPMTLKYLLDDSFTTIAPFLKPHQLECLQAAIAQIKYQLRDFPQEPPFWGICWGDPHSGNAHFTADNQVMLFDFDQCGYGWRAFDIAKFLQVALSTGVGKTVRESFLSGYRSVQDVTDLEINSLQAFTQVAQIWRWAISVTYANLHAYSRLDDYYFNVRLEQLKRFQSPDWQLF
ncbi:MAG: phosphotransferase [Leptolyngbyaceae cyanobacterium CSU_1_3]|nr:phosphotransferase [Leptolyngbyaceae cyanobacterium CSU_1_3]